MPGGRSAVRGRHKERMERMDGKEGRRDRTERREKREEKRARHLFDLTESVARHRHDNINEGRRANEAAKKKNAALDLFDPAPHVPPPSILPSTPHPSSLRPSSRLSLSSLTSPLSVRSFVANPSVSPSLHSPRASSLNPRLADCRSGLAPPLYRSDRLLGGRFAQSHELASFCRATGSNTLMRR